VSALPDFNLNDLDVQKQLLALERFDYETDLYKFLEAAWPSIDSAEWIPSWAVAAMAEHLQAVCDGDIKRLIINIPPRHAKSSLVSVAFPTWVWTQQNLSPTSGPGVQFLSASYANQLALRDSVKSRRLIESAFYQKYWGDRFSLNSDQNTKSRYSNDKGGERLITSVGAAVTGEGGDIILIDDPNSATEAFSEATIQATIDWWTGTMSTRLNNQRTGAYVVIQQRLAENDLTGYLLEQEHDGWNHLCLPMRYEWRRSYHTSIGWCDPRGADDEGEPLALNLGGVLVPRDESAADELAKREGTLLSPDRFGEEEVKSLERTLGKYGAAGQLQQRPEPQGGGIIKSEWWLPWEEAKFPPMDYVVGTIDSAFTAKTSNDPSAMTVWGVFSPDAKAAAARSIAADGRPIYTDRAYDESAPKAMLMYAWDKHLEFHDLIREIDKTCQLMRLAGNPVDMLLIENKASGISLAQEMRRLYGSAEFGVQLSDPKSLDKVARLFSVQHIFEEGIVFAPDKAWAQRVITQVGQFPRGKHDDLVDCCSMAVRHLRDIGVLTRQAERLQEVQDALVYPSASASAPLYPA